MSLFLAAHEDLIDYRKRRFIVESEFDSPELSSTPLPSHLAELMDEQLINMLRQETHIDQNPYHQDEFGPLFLSNTDPNQHAQKMHQMAMAHQQHLAISTMIAATTGSLFNPFTLAINPLGYQSLTPLHALNTPHTMMMQDAFADHPHQVKQPSASALSEDRAGALKRSRASQSSTPEPPTPQAKKAKGDKAEGSGDKPTNRPVSARALALDKEVLMLHEIDRPVAERMIRDKLGNNPDTSKSLRRLALEGKVVRHGVGGRGEPFRYELTQLGREIYRQYKLKGATAKAKD